MGDAPSYYDPQLARLTRRERFEHVDAVRFDPRDRLPEGVDTSAADALFDTTVPPGARKRPKRQRQWALLCWRAAEAIQRCGCVDYRRNERDCPQITRTMIDRACEAGWFLPETTKRLPPSVAKLKPSRLFPTAALMERLAPLGGPRFVEVRDRETKEALPFPEDHPTAVDTQRRLLLVYRVNARFAITCQKLSKRNNPIRGKRQVLRPIHKAIFTDDFTLHGRLYTGSLGQQNIPGKYRKTITFAGEPSVELDYGGFHPRALYHRLGIDYSGDPYALWQFPTVIPQEVRLASRRMAKLAVNTAINARDDQKALSACNFAASLYEEASGGRRKLKTGRDLHKASQLIAAQGLLRSPQRLRRLSAALTDEQIDLLARCAEFSCVIQRAKETHRRLADAGLFCSDQGIRLMRDDSAIALDVLHHFASQGKPALGVHDSFIVRASDEAELRTVMTDFYQARFGFAPVIKRA